MTQPITSLDDPRYVKALSHPLRVRIYAMLSERSASPVELSASLDATLGTIAYHVRALKDFGMIELVGERRVRGAVEHSYRAIERPRLSDVDWGRASSMTKQVAADSSLQIINEYARLAAGAGGFDRAETHLSRALLALDDEGWAQTAAAFGELVTRLGEIERDAAERIAADGSAEAPSDAAVVLMSFETRPPPPPAESRKRPFTPVDPDAADEPSTR